MTALVWVILLLVVGLAVMVLEVFVPSGGVLGFLSVLAIGAAIVTAFVEQGMATGFGVLAAAFVAVPAVLALAFRWFPETPLGRRVLPPPPGPADVLPAADRRRKLRDLVGRGGRVASELVPWGTVVIDGETIEARSEAGLLAAGVVVEVAGVDGMAVVVRPKTAPVAPAAPPAPPEQPASGRSPALEDFDVDHLLPPPA